MTETEPLIVTLELPASEFMEHGGGILVRCPINKTWVPLANYYSEIQGQLLPLVGTVDYAEAPEHWFDTGERIPIMYKDPKTGAETQVGEDIVMAKATKGAPVVWKETVRILEKVIESEPEGGTLSFSVGDGVGVVDKFGG